MKPHVSTPYVPMRCYTSSSYASYCSSTMKFEVSPLECPRCGALGYETCKEAHTTAVAMHEERRAVSALLGEPLEYRLATVWSATL